jgi:multiple sugar transport system substrate-binding protein
MMQIVIYDDIAIRPICEYLIKEDTNNIEMGDMKMKKKVLSILVSLTIAVSLLAACGGSDPETSTTSSPNQETTTGEASDTTEPSSGEDIVLEFTQWWEPELADGAFRGLMDKFESQNPGIKVELISGPYASTKEQVVAGAAAGTMSDVVGLDGAWVSDFVNQGALASLTDLMASSNYDDSELAAQIKLNDKTYMIPVVNYVYPVFVNNDLLSQAGIAELPTNRTEFLEAAKAIAALDSNVYGWVLPLSLEAPNGVQNDIMSWVWASGKSMMSNGKPNVNNADVKSALEFIKELYDAEAIALGSFSMKEQDKVEEFTNERVGMMVSSLSHINMIRERNPELDFSIMAMPAEDGYAGERGMPYASWGIGVAENSPNKAEAWKLVEFLMSEEINSELSTIANAFPGNSNSKPDFSKSDELFEVAFDIYSAGYPANEFVGLPVAEDLMRTFASEYQIVLEGDQSIDEMLATVQSEWEKEFE